MAEVRSIDEIGKSLLAKQASIRKSQRKRSRKNERINQALGVLMAGQSVFQSALSRRMKEYDSVNKLSQLRTRTQTPRIQEMSRYYSNLNSNFTKDENLSWEDNWEEWKLNYDAVDNFKNIIKPRVHKLIESQTGIGTYDEPGLISTYEPLELAAAHEMAKEMFKNEETFMLGLKEFGAGEYDELSTAEMLNLYTNLNPEDIDIKKAKIFNDHVSRLTGSPFNTRNMRNVLSGLSFGLIKPSKEGNIFRRVDDVPQELANFQKAVQVIDPDALVLDVISTKLSTHRRWDILNDAELTGITNTYDTITDRTLSKGNLMHAMARFRYNDFKAQIDDPRNVVVKEELLNKAGGLTKRILSDTTFKRNLITDYKKGSFTKGIKPSIEQVTEFTKKLDSRAGAQQVALLTVIATSVTDKNYWIDRKPSRRDNFTIDFSTINTILEPTYIPDEKGELTPNNTSGNVTEEDQIRFVQGLHQDQDIPLTTEEKDKILDTVPDLSQVTRDKAIRDLDDEEDDEFLFGEEDEYPRNVTPFGPPPEEGARRRKIVSEGWENLKWEAGDRAALEKFVKTGKTTGSYGRETRFYEALERAGLPKDATQEMVREYLES